MIALLLAVLSVLAYALPIISTPHADMDLTAEQICTKYGYKYSTYKVTTSDGYILMLARLSGWLNELEPGASG
jgi:hypothetical protein